jgi:hypothetical protein
MKPNLTKEEIAFYILKAQEDFNKYAGSLTNEGFFNQPGNKWSVAQHTRHLITSVNSARLAYSLPKLFVKWIGGIANRPSMTYHDLVSKYKMKLEKGGRANGRYIPKPVLNKYNPKKILQELDNAAKKMAASLKKNSTEADLDNYVVPHPLLGKITLRELGYFTIYHTYHHLNNISGSFGS